MSERERNSTPLYELELTPDDPRLETPHEVEIPDGLKRENTSPEQRAPYSPGKILEQVYLEPLGLTQQQLADTIGVSRRLINEVVNEKRSVTPRTALKLARALHTSPMFWINLQNRFELWKLNQDKELRAELNKVESVV